MAAGQTSRPGAAMAPPPSSTPGAARAGAVHLRVEDALLLAQRPGDELAFRVDDGAIADVDPLAGALVERLQRRGLLEDVRLAQRHAAADDKGAALLGDVAEGGEPGFAAVPGGGHVDLRAPGVHCVA